MGRRPDVLMSTYFERGEKLPDASNRYSFSCKGCGSLFPKGRTSHLLNHLLKNENRCPALTPSDLANIIAVQASKSAEQAQRTPTKRPASYSFLDRPTLANEGPPTKKQAVQSSGRSDSLSGLEALAEASRQVERPSDDRATRYSSGFGEELLIDPELHNANIFGSQHPETTSELSSIAASASNLGESLPPSRGGLSTTDEPTTPVHAIRHDLTTDEMVQHLSAAVQFPVLIAASTTASNQDISPRNPTRNGKSRSRFSDERREQVRDIRSKRACIRCRMLRKPCSPEDPCARCVSIKNPRVWSSRCVRGRLGDVCDIFTARNNTESIREVLLRLQKIPNHFDIDSILRVFLEEDQLSPTDFSVTALYPPITDHTTKLIPDVVVPLELDSHTLGELRNLVLQTDITTLPIEVQRVIAYGRSLRTDYEFQFFQTAEVLYLYTVLQIVSSSTFKFQLLQASEHGRQVMDIGPSGNKALDLAFKSMLEARSQAACESLLKNMEPALVQRSVSSQAILAAAMMFFFSIELLEYQLGSEQHKLADQELAKEKDSSWFLPDSPMVWLEKLSNFSSFMRDLLRCRHIVEALEVDENDTLAVVATSKADAMKDMFASLNITTSLLHRADAVFVVDDPNCLYFKHNALMLSMSQSKDLVKSKE